MPILRVFDFDNTITKKHTENHPFETPSENTKEGLQNYLIHDSEQITAIASFHDDPEIILSYLSPLLQIEEGDITSIEIKEFETHKLNVYYLKERKYPLIISTRTDVENFRDKGKNFALKEIINCLPECSEYHFYDDDELNIKQALGLNQFFCHLIAPTKNQFEIDLKGSLLIFLQHQVKENILNKTRTIDLNNSNLLFSTPKNNWKSCDVLINSLIKDKPLDYEELLDVKNGPIGNKIELWEKHSPKKLEELISISNYPKIN